MLQSRSSDAEGHVLPPYRGSVRLRVRVCRPLLHVTGVTPSRVHEQRRKQKLGAKPQEAFINALQAENVEVMDKFTDAMEKRMQERRTPGPERPTANLSYPNME